MMKYYTSSPDNISLFTKTMGLYFTCVVLGCVNLGAVGSLLKLIATLPILVWTVEKKGKIFWNNLNAGFFLFTICCFFSLFWSIDQAHSFSRSITQVMFLILLLCSAAFEYNEKELTFLKKSLIWSSRITCIFTLLGSNYYQGRLYLTGVIKEDPNYLCAYLACGLVYCIQVILSKNKIKRKIFSAIEIILYAYVGVSTGSRGGMLALLSCSVVAMFISFDKKNLQPRRIGGEILLLTIGCLTIYFCTLWIPSDIMQRFRIDDILKSNGTGRFTIWRDAVHTFHNSKILRQLFGYGTGTALKIAEIFNYTYVNVTHNIFLENLLEIGAVGATFYIIHVLVYFNAARKQKDVFSLAVIICMIVLSLSTSIHAFKPFWNIVIYILCNSQKVSDIKSD